MNETDWNYLELHLAIDPFPTLAEFRELQAVEMLRLHKEGMTNDAIAERLGVSNVTVRNRIAKHPDYEPYRSYRWRKGSERGVEPETLEKIRIVVELRKEGKTLKQCGEAIGATREYARQLILREGEAE